VKKIAIIVGTRPEGIKLAPIIKRAQTQFKNEIEINVIASGQHEDILNDVFQLFEIKPDIILKIDRKSTLLSEIQSEMIYKLERHFENQKPDIVIVQGDTTTTLSGALAAFYQKIPIAYIESGLRSGDLYAPFPEEAHRRLVTQISTWQFTPTKKATQTLLSEGINKNVYEVGNTIIDALIHIQKNAFKKDHHDWSKHKINGRKTMMVTIHRRENWGQNLDNILNALKEIANKFNDTLDIVWVAHPNPMLHQDIKSNTEAIENIHVYPPTNYVKLLHLMSMSYLILTDSGGIQEEAPSFNVPVLVARDVTERIEGIELGCAKLVGTQTETIVKEVCVLIENSDQYKKMTGFRNPYGDGTASQKILNILNQDKV
tara:strand:- start:183 stop:1301 length:1119 start_codon:yes stop_codon:yes gene_type:complete